LITYICENNHISTHLHIHYTNYLSFSYRWCCRESWSAN